MDTKHIIELTHRLIRALDIHYNVVNASDVVAVITELEQTPVTREQLLATRLAKYINQLRQQIKSTNEVLARRAKSLLKKWRTMLNITDSSGDLHHPVISENESLTSLRSIVTAGLGEISNTENENNVIKYAERFQGNVHNGGIKHMPHVILNSNNSSIVSNISASNHLHASMAVKSERNRTFVPNKELLPKNGLVLPKNVHVNTKYIPVQGMQSTPIIIDSSDSDEDNAAQRNHSPVASSMDTILQISGLLKPHKVPVAINSTEAVHASEKTIATDGIQTSVRRLESKSSLKTAQPKKRGRKRPFESFNKNESSLPQPIFLTSGVKKVKTTQEILEEMKTRSSNISTGNLSAEDISSMSNPGVIYNPMNKLSATSTGVLIDDSESDSLPSDQTLGSMKSERKHEDIQGSNSDSQSAVLMGTVRPQSIQNPLQFLQAQLQRAFENLPPLHTVSKIEEDHKFYSALCTCTVVDDFLDETQLDNVDANGFQETNLVRDASSLKSNAMEQVGTVEMKLKCAPTVSVEKSSVAERRSVKSIFDLDFEDVSDVSSDPTLCALMDVANHHDSENESKHLVLTPDIQSLNRLARQSSTDNLLTIKPPIDFAKRFMQPRKRVVEDFYCEAKKSFEAKNKKICEFHVNSLLNYCIPNVNGNWDHTTKAFDDANSPINVKPYKVTDGSDVVPAMKSIVNNLIPKNLSSYIFQPNCTLKMPHLNSWRTRTLFLGSAETLPACQYYGRTAWNSECKENVKELSKDLQYANTNDDSYETQKSQRPFCNNLKCIKKNEPLQAENSTKCGAGYLVQKMESDVDIREIKQLFFFDEVCYYNDSGVGHSIFDDKYCGPVSSEKELQKADILLDTTKINQHHKEIASDTCRAITTCEISGSRDIADRNISFQKFAFLKTESIEIESSRPAQEQLEVSVTGAGNKEEGEENNVESGFKTGFRLVGRNTYQEFKEWHEVVHLRSYKNELLTVLPYVVID